MRPLWWEGCRGALIRRKTFAYQLDGLILLIEDTGRDPETGAIVFNALATIAFDDTSGTHRFRAHNEGNYLDTELIVRENGVERGTRADPRR